MDEEIMNQYLVEVERNLKHMNGDERKDIVAEIRSHILVTQLEKHEDMKQILHRLGRPNELARCYQGQLIADKNQFSIGNFMRTILFFGAFGVKEFVLSVLAGSLYLAAVLALVGGVVKTCGTFLGFDMSKVKFVVGFGEVPPQFSLLLSIPLAIIFYFCSKFIWKNIRHRLKKN